MFAKGLVTAAVIVAPFLTVVATGSASSTNALPGWHSCTDEDGHTRLVPEGTPCVIYRVTT